MYYFNSLKKKFYKNYFYLGNYFTLIFGYLLFVDNFTRLICCDKSKQN